MAAPTDFPDYATDANYSSGPDVGTPTKIEPTSGEIASGNIRGTPPSPQKFNWWQGLVGQWVRYFSDITNDCACYDVGGGSRSDGELFQLSTSDGFAGSGFQLFTSGTGHEVQVPAAGTYWVSIYGPLLASVTGSVVRRGVSVSPDGSGPARRLTAMGWRPTTDNSSPIDVAGAKPIEITDPATQRLRVAVVNAPSGTVTASGTMFLSIVRIK